MRLVLRQFIVLSALQAVAIGCVLPDGSPCRTVHAVFSGWEIRWGFHIYRSHGEVTDAHRSDGAWTQRSSGSTWHFHWVPEKVAGDFAEIILPFEQLVVGVDFSAKEYSIQPPYAVCCLAPVIARPTSPRPVSDCLFPGPDEYAGRFSKQVQTEIVNGFLAIRFDKQAGRLLDFEPDEVTIWLAPSPGCQEVKVRLTWKNSFGLPWKVQNIDVNTFQFGEPDSALFLPPPAFRKVR